MSKLGEIIRYNREEQGMSVRQLAEDAGVSYGYISAIENGRFSNPTYESLEKIAGALGVSLEKMSESHEGVPREVIDEMKRRHILVVLVERAMGHDDFSIEEIINGL